MFDLGTGLRYFGKACDQNGGFRGVCLLSHMHWDHVQGLPFFVPTLQPGAHFDVYAPTQEDGRSVDDVIRSLIKPPTFPVTIDDFPGTFAFHDIADDDFMIGNFAVKSRLVPHIGNTLGFRVTLGDSSVVYLSDHQMPFDGSMSITDGARELCQGADVLIHDSQYTSDEFAQKYNWGHCTIDYALWVAIECQVKTLVLFHHDPSRHDDELDAILARVVSEGAAAGVNVVAAHEGLTLHA